MSAAGSSKRTELLPGIEYATPVPPVINLMGKSKLPFTHEELDALNKPKVLISGGGIGGLTLALLLHKANVPFLVLERAKEIKPLGSAIILGSTVAPLFIQLGIYDEFVKLGKVHSLFHMLNEDLTTSHTMNVTWLKDAVGYDEYVISRPDLYNILFNSIPRERILLGKRVLSFSQNDTSVLVQCSDNSSYHGDILVGADGAYSAVRQQLYNALKLDKKLPASDDVSLPYSCVCLVGQTEVLDPEEFPQMKSDIAQNYSVLGASTMCSWITLTTKANTLCWVVIKFLDKESSKQNDSFRCSEWGPEAAEAMAKEVRHFKVPGGKDAKVLTLGDYIDKTPKHLISKVMLEEIVFDTWFSGRTVLMGDACHKMNPSGGSGAITAIHDAVTLANWISTLRSGTVNGIEKVFKEYRDERHPVAKKAYEASQMFHRTFGNSFVSVVVRGLMKRLPHWLWRRIILKMFSAKLQASFLPLVEDNASVRSSYQASLQKTLPILKKFQEESAIQGTLSSVPIAV